MDSNIKYLIVQIVRFVDGGFPGWVQCEFMDAEGRKHSLIDKVSTFISKSLDAESSYPQGGVVRCKILSQSCDEKQRELVRVTTARPDVVESTEGLSEFVVLSTQLQPAPRPS